MPSFLRLIPFAVLICLVGVPALGADTRIARGRQFAQTHCATCHAIGPAGASPYAPAPPFRTLHLRYPVENIAEALAEGITVAHQGARQMPEFVLTVSEIDDLLAYLKSLE
jgi:mono/diheme cytochrome c family protein